MDDSYYYNTQSEDEAFDEPITQQNKQDIELLKGPRLIKKEWIKQNETINYYNEDEELEIALIKSLQETNIK
jgi:hypothetical protein